MTRWYRAYEGTVTDAKLAEVALIVGCSRSVVIATWHAILENAASLNEGGHIDIPSRRIAAILCEPFDTIETLMAALEAVGLIHDSQVVSWKKRQFESDSSTERSRKHRQASRNADATLQQQHATPPETETETETEEEVRGLTPSSGPDPIDEARELWNEAAERYRLPVVARFTDGRRKALKARLSDLGGIEGWRAMIEIIGKSPLLLGQSDRGWRASFDWVLKPANLTKIMEGNYVRTSTNQPNSIAAGFADINATLDECIRREEGNCDSAEDSFGLSRLRQSAA